MELGWREIAALWGAGLSTVLALLKFLPLAPQFIFEPDGFGDKTRSCFLRISNPGVSTLYIRVRGRFKLCWGDHALAIYARGTRMSDAEGTNSIYAVAPNEEIRIEVLLTSPDSRWLVVWSWHRGWLLPLRLPMLTYFSGPRMEEMSNAIRQ